jgi:hypothetical protein
MALGARGISREPRARRRVQTAILWRSAVLPQSHQCDNRVATNPTTMAIAVMAIMKLRKLNRDGKS